MTTEQPLQLLGGLSPAQFMKKHWHKKPLLIRQAIPGFKPFLSRAELQALALQDDVEARVIVQHDEGWTLQRSPLAKKHFPKLSQPRWTFLVQGVDLHNDQAHALVRQFRWVPDARLDDLMISYATDGGGVGPHFDSYDVFLLQAHGRRHWRIGRVPQPELQEGVPLKILTNFVPEEEHVLEPGDMLYLPPGWAHDGIAEGECMTYSIGFRSPHRTELAREVMLRWLEGLEAPEDDPIYRDPKQVAVDEPGRMPAELQSFAREGLMQLLKDPVALDRALGEYMTEPKPQVWFPIAEADDVGVGVALDRRTRMSYDARHVFINGESFVAGGTDFRLMRQLADSRSLPAAGVSAARPPPAASLITA